MNKSQEASAKKETQKKEVSKKEAKKKEAPKKDRFQFFKDVKQELKRCTWPTKKDVTQWSGVVVAALLFFGIYVAILDNFVVTPALVGVSSVDIEGITPQTEKEIQSANSSSSDSSSSTDSTSTSTSTSDQIITSDQLESLGSTDSSSTDSSTTERVETNESDSSSTSGSTGGQE